MHIAILGGTSEASALARTLESHRKAGRLEFILSLAGRTQLPIQPVPYRCGGFGGVDGLCAFLVAQRITHLIDATHPFARRMSANAAAASQRTGTPLLQLSRPAWSLQPGDQWREFDTMQDIVAALGSRPRRIFLTHGRLDLDLFAAAPQHTYLVRTIDPPPGLEGLNHRLILERGPFDADAEEALMRREAIDLLISKNSGGAATYGKIIAARRLAIPVSMLRRPPPEACPQAQNVDEVLAWLHLAPP